MACVACGLTAALCSMLSFGSFGVPIKSDASKSVDIHPLVFQSYKTFVCFVTSFLIVLTGEPFYVSPWGILSGIFWVPSGIATVYAIKAAGLAIGIGTGSSGIVLSSFLWGILFFGEKVRSIHVACSAILLLMMGLLGMSYFSAPPTGGGGGGTPTSKSKSIDSTYVDDFETRSDDGTTLPLLVTPKNRILQRSNTGQEKDNTKMAVLTNRGRPVHPPPDHEQKVEGNNDNSASTADTVDDEDLALFDPPTTPAQTVTVFGRKIPKREWGMFVAGVFGLWGGSIMAPMKMSDAQGSHFLLSFGFGAAIVNLGIWLVLFLAKLYQYGGSTTDAIGALPPLHLRVMWLPGCTSGLLWSIGNFFSMISVFYLGQGVGYPVVQSHMLVSGLWGIFYFKEVQGGERIFKWFLSSLITLSGILLLSYQHVDEATART